MEKIDEIIICKASDYKGPCIFKITVNLNKFMTDNTLPKIKECLHSHSRNRFRARIYWDYGEHISFSKPSK